MPFNAMSSAVSTVHAQSLIGNGSLSLIGNGSLSQGCMLDGAAFPG